MFHIIGIISTILFCATSLLISFFLVKEFILERDYYKNLDEIDRRTSNRLLEYAKWLSTIDTNFSDALEDLSYGRDIAMVKASLQEKIAKLPQYEAVAKDAARLLQETWGVLDKSPNWGDGEILEAKNKIRDFLYSLHINTTK